MRRSANKIAIRGSERARKKVCTYNTSCLHCLHQALREDLGADFIPRALHYPRWKLLQRSDRADEINGLLKRAAEEEPTFEKCDRLCLG